MRPTPVKATRGSSDRDRGGRRWPELLWGGSGLPIQRPREGTWDLIFKEDRVYVRQTIGQADGQTLPLDWWA